MKRPIAVILCLLSAALLITSCGDATTPSDTSSASPSQTIAATTRSTAKSTAATTTSTTAAPTTQNVTMSSSPINYALPADGEIITKVKFDEQMIEGLECDKMYLCYKTYFTMDGQQATAELYIDSSPDEEGRLFLKDGQCWSLLVRQGEDVYPLIHKKWVQDGRLKYYFNSLYTERNNKDDDPIRITLIWETSTGLTIYRYDNQPQDGHFVVKKAYQTDEGYRLEGHSQGNGPNIIYGGP